MNIRPIFATRERLGSCPSLLSRLKPFWRSLNTLNMEEIERCSAPPVDAGYQVLSAIVRSPILLEVVAYLCSFAILLRLKV